MKHLVTAHLWKWFTLGIENVNSRFLFTGYGLNSASVKGEEKTLTYHRYIEALKFANGLKKHIRDPRFSSDEVSFRKGSSENVCIFHTLLMYISALFVSS